jgi:hypothetical protein
MICGGLVVALKKRFTDEEKYGLSVEEIKAATRHLRKFKTAGAVPEHEAAKLFELYLLGDSLPKIASQFPQYTLGQIALTAALRQWAKDREKMMHTLQDRVRAKVVRSVLEQVDFLTSMLAVSNAEHLETMMKYVQDPLNNPKPELRISSIKEYKDVAETLGKIVAGATPTPTGGGNTKRSPMFDALTPVPERVMIAKQKEIKEEEENISIMDAVEA